MRIDLGTLRLGPGISPGTGLPVVFSLEAGEFLRLEPGEAVEVRCHTGRLWITREASPEDLWLSGGEAAVVDPAGLTLVEAIGLTHVSVRSSRDWPEEGRAR